MDFSLKYYCDQKKIIAKGENPSTKGGNSNSVIRLGESVIKDFTIDI